jgi:hypothetical protein
MGITDAITRAEFWLLRRRFRQIGESLETRPKDPALHEAATATFVRMMELYHQPKSTTEFQA